MPPTESLPLFMLSALALLLIPGPAVLYIVTRSISQGRAAGLSSVAGVQCGALVHVAAATLGLSAVLLSSALLFNIVKFAGAAYLIFLGVQQLRSRSSGPALELKSEPLGKIFMQGFVVNALNPKTALFFFAFIPQFVGVKLGHVPLQFLVLGVLFIAIACITDSLYALLSSTLGPWLRRSRTFWKRQKYVTGAVYIGLGVTAVTTGHR